MCLKGYGGPLHMEQSHSVDLRDLVLLRRVRDWIDREYARALDIDALARAVNVPAGHLSREFKRAYGESPYSYLVTRRAERQMALLRAQAAAGLPSVSDDPFTG